MKGKKILFIPAAVWIFFTGCSGSTLVTKIGEQSSINDLTYDQFSYRRTGKIFEAILIDSMRVPMRLVTARSDSILYQTLDSGIARSIPTASVSVLLYRQNINGLNAAVGGFIGCLSMSYYVSTWNKLFSPDESNAVIAGICIIGGTTIGAVIGYNLNTEHEYRFKPQSKITH